MQFQLGQLLQDVKMATTAIARDIRSGQIKMLVISTSLGVAALSSVGFLSNRLESGLERDARQMLGGDAVVTSSSPTPEEIVLKARSLNLQASQTLSFPTMARVGFTEDPIENAKINPKPNTQNNTTTNPTKTQIDAQLSATPVKNPRTRETRLVALKAVDSAYPLRGELKVLAPNALVNTPSQVIKGIPVKGEVWVEAGLLEALGVAQGEPIAIGQAQFKVAQVLTFEPDKGVGFMSFAPRVLMNRSDLESTQLVQPTSRINWRFAVAGEDSAVKEFSSWVQNNIETSANRGVRIETLETGRPEVRQTLDRAAKFLRLVALLAVILSAVAIALAARNYSHQHIQECAMRRVLGQSHRAIVKLFVIEFIMLGLFASALGLVLGYGVHFVFIQMLSGLVNTALPLPNYVPVFQGVGVGLCSLLAFGLPPVLQLASVPALLVMRQELGAVNRMPILVWALGVLGLCLLMALVSQDLLLVLSVVGGFLSAIAIFALCSKGAIIILRRWVNEHTSPLWLRIATRQINANSAYSVLQISSLAVGLLALLLLILLRTDLIQSWRNATPEDAPNRFVINIQSDQAQDFQAALRANGVDKFDWYPMIKARLIAINNEAVTANRYSDERAQHLVDREFNLSHSDQVPANNQIVAGRWLANEENSLSIEEGIAKTLHLSLGDTLRFDISGFIYEAKITSVRKVDWSSMRTNFFVILPVKDMEDLPQSYIAAFKAPSARGFDNKLVHQFPSVTEIDIGSTLNQIQTILEQVTSAVEFLFVFTLLAGLIVLVACIHSTLASRVKEYALIRALGGGNQLLVQIQRAELWGMGALAGLLASVCASLIGWGLAKYVFEFEWVVSPFFILFGTCLGVLIAWAAGGLSLRSVLSQSVVQSLRTH